VGRVGTEQRLGGWLDEGLAEVSNLEAGKARTTFFPFGETGSSTIRPLCKRESIILLQCDNKSFRKLLTNLIGIKNYT
jgi:hypothetical protein